MIMPSMIRLRRGTVLEVLAERPGAIELRVGVDETPGNPAVDPAQAIAYPALVGPVSLGDRVLLNTTAIALGLGTGGLHFVVAVEGPGGGDLLPVGRTMKLRYTPHQVQVLAAEEEHSPHRDAILAADGLEGLPVVWAPLHSMVGPVAAGARAAGAERIAYVMTGGAALPAALSRSAADLRRSGLLDTVITSGQAFGGDLETVNTFTGLLAARWAAGADVAVVGDGPGNTGTHTMWGATDIESAMSLNAAAILGGRPVAALRVSFADRRERHRGVSHHSLTALSRVAMVPVHVSVPVMEDEGHRQAVWAALRQAKLDERHQLVEVNGQPALDVLAEHGIEPASMGRGVAEDPEYFLAAGSAGVLAGRMAAGDRAWRSRTRGG
jgi:hypothetical protein